MEHQGIFNDSYGRILPRLNEFFEKFYETFLASSDDVCQLFQQTNMDRQIEMIQSSFIFITNYSAAKNSCLNKELNHLIQLHKKIAGITPDMCDLWLDSLIQTVAIMDPGYNEQVAQAWKTTLSPAVNQMKQGLT